MMLGKTLIRWLISIIAIIAIAIIILLTPIGLRIGLHIASNMLPGKITYTHASGVITGPVAIRNFEYTDGKTILRIHKLKFSWRPWQLIHRTIDVSHFTANNVHLTLRLAKSKKAKEEKRAKKKLPKKAFLLNIHRAHINYLSIGYKPNQYPTFIRHIRLKAVFVPERINIRAFAQMTKPFPLSTTFHINGNLDRYKIYVRAISKKLDWHLYGLGNAYGVFVNLNEGKTLGGSLSFNANVHWSPQFDWSVKLNAAHLNFKTLNSDWPNQVTAKINSTGKFESGKPKFRLKALINAPDTHIDLITVQEDKLNLKWDVNVKKLSSIYKQFKGSIQSKGEWAPDAKTPVIKGQLQASNIAALGYSANHLTGKWTLHPNQQRDSNFNLDANSFRNNGLQISRIKLQGKGKTSKHQLQGDITYLGNHFVFQMQGGMFNKQWKGKLQKLTISSSPYRNWALTKTANLALSSTRASTQNLCLKTTGIKGELCATGNWNAQGPWQFSVIGKHFDPAFLTHFAMPKLTLKSPSTLRATVSGNGKRFQSAKVNLLLQKGSFRYQLNGNYISSPLQSGNLHFLYTQNTLSASSQLFLAKNNQVAFSISIPKFSPEIPKKKLRLRGRLTANFNDLYPFNKVLQAVAHPKGKLTLNLSVSGHLGSPDLEGRIHLFDGSVYIPRLGIELTKIDTNISSFSQTRMNFKVTAYSKNQPIHITGDLIQTPQGLKNTTYITGNNFLIMNTPEYAIYASPKLKVDISGYNINLSGSVDIPEGVIQPGEFNNVTSIPSDQIVYTAGEPITGTSTWHISADVTATLGDKVIVKTSGFNVHVNGKARIIGKPRKTTLANGRINVVKGTYSAYGRTLNITPGSFIEFLNSPVNNPTLSVRATKMVQVTQTITGSQIGGGSLNNIIVGIDVRGSFRHPKISFFSVPANLSQADILSYLVLGYASNTTSGSNLGILLEAANTLGGKGTGIGGAISEIKQGLGLSELGVESETLINAVGTPIDQQTAFVIGKRLTKNIYIRYSLGLGQGPFAPVNIFQLRYTFNRHWALQTDSSSLGNGGDILYTIQTD